MEILLRVDFNGNPYLQLKSNMVYPPDETTADSEMLEYFIREGQRKGVHIKNESDSELDDAYASIRLGRKVAPGEIIFKDET